MVKTLAIKPDTDSSEKVQILKEGGFLPRTGAAG